MSEELLGLLSSIDNPDQIEKLLLESKSVSYHPNQAVLESNAHSRQSVTNGQYRRKDDGKYDLHNMYSRYLDNRSGNSPTTITQYKRVLPHFIDFATARDIFQTTVIHSDLIDDYVTALKEEFPSDATVLTYTKNLRAWLNWLQLRDKCDADLMYLLNRKNLALNPRARDEALSLKEAECILPNLRKQHFGTDFHTVLELGYNAGPRLGGIHSLDLCDFDPSNGVLSFEHRPHRGTRLKNGCENDSTPGDGEREIDLNDASVEALRVYIEEERHDVTDKYGRAPLFASRRGRTAKSTLRRRIYKATSCAFNDVAQERLHCDGQCHPDSNVCECSVSPHGIRRGSIVAYLDGGLAHGKASERFNVSISTIEKHYDPRVESRKRRKRSDAVRKAAAAMP